MLNGICLQQRHSSDVRGDMCSDTVEEQFTLLFALIKAIIITPEKK